MQKTYIPFLLSFITGCFVLTIPVLREFHLFSAMVAAVAGAIWGGLKGASLKDNGNNTVSELRELALVTLAVLTAGIPLLIGAFFRDCFSTDGLFFWILLPMPSIFLGFSIGRYLKLNQYKRPKLLTVILLLSVGFGSLIIEIYFFPQVYFFNHIFGYFPGPIYDESITLNTSLVFFRYMSVAWALIFWLMPAYSTSKYIRLTLLFCTLSLMLCYIGLSRAGIISPESHLQRSLGAVYQTEHFTLFYDRRIPITDIEYLAELHEFHAQELEGILNISMDTSKPIRSYLYYHEWQKKKLTGAGTTSYVPVWNPNAQLHMHYQVASSILRHELVHVLSRQFGMPFIHASPNIALVEGLATALETQRNPVATRDELVAGLSETPDFDYMQNLMSISGFYTNHGSVSYTVAGSFTGWMLNNKPLSSVKKAYRTGRVDADDDISFKELILEWQRYIELIDVDSTQTELAHRIFSLPGITEISCPFIAGQESVAVDNARFYMAERDTASAISSLESFIENTQTYSPQTAIILSKLLLQTDQSSKVIQLFNDTIFPSEQFKLLLADAHFISGDISFARQLLETSVSDSLSLHIRRNDEIWRALATITYNKNMIHSKDLPDELFPFFLRRVVQSEWELIEYPRPVVESTITDPRLFLHYVSYTDYLIKMKQMDYARSWLTSLKHGAKSEAMNRIIDERIRFMHFLEHKHSTL